MCVPKVPNLNGTKPKSIVHPHVLRIAVAILVCPQCMRYTLQGVDNGTGEVVGRIHLPLVSVKYVALAKVTRTRALAKSLTLLDGVGLCWYDI